MAFITNQWLKWPVERNREHYPIKVTIKPGLSVDDWSLRNKISRDMFITRENGDYHEIYFTKGDLDKAVPLLAAGASIAVRKRVAMDALTDLHDDEFVDFINRALIRRIAAKRRAKSKTG